MSVTISVITATYNAINHLPRLIESLRSQTDKDFDWIIADGGSDDGTLEYLTTIGDLKLTVDSQADFGIYDALNRAIKLSSSDYYIVIGADDYFYPDAIENFKCSILKNKHVDFLAAGINVSGVDVRPKLKSNSWLIGQMAFVAGHAVGLAIRNDLHQEIGFYSNKFPIASDQFFIMKAIANGADVVRSDFIAGYFSSEGLSSVDYTGTATEFFRVQVLLGANKYLQIFILFLRLLKNVKKL